jgi:phospholipid-binding lipoprotein MlaA
MYILAMGPFMKKILIMMSAVLVLGMASASAQAPDAYRTQRDASMYTYDPLEPFNRSVFVFNKYVDMLLIKPVAKGYKWILPSPVRTGVYNFLTNLASPVSFINELLQGDLAGADIVLRRFVVNSILGVGGVMDAAEMHGLGPIPREDFGQTLGVWGVGPGPYLVVPILGPSNLRDLTGRVVDIFTDPVNLWAINQDKDWIPWTRAIVGGIDTRARLLGPYDDIMNNSVDPYSSFRSMYSQNRTYAVGDRVYKEGGAVMDTYSMTENDF